MIWIIIGVIVIIILIFFSAFFAAAEMAFVSADKAKIREQAMKGNKKAKILEDLMQNPDEVVSAIVVGNNLLTFLPQYLLEPLQLIFLEV